MRLLSPRPSLPQLTTEKLSRETRAIQDAPAPKAESMRRFNNARGAKWFQPVVAALKKMAGKGQRCMYCSGNEASDVEHYRPKAVFPEHAMEWGNYLWTCTICNRHKADRFPPDTQPGARLINPAEEDPWQFFFIDEYGLLTPRYDRDADAPNARAESTQDIVRLNREVLQEARKERLDDLKGRAREWSDQRKSGVKSSSQVRKEIDAWRQQPFQPDVADYFLRGPGREEAPFNELFRAIEESE